MQIRTEKMISENSEKKIICYSRKYIYSNTEIPAQLFDIYSFNYENITQTFVPLNILKFNNF